MTGADTGRRPVRRLTAQDADDRTAAPVSLGMADLLTPGEVASQLGVQDRTVRRMAAAYESVFEELPRLRPNDDRSPRLWPVDAARRVQVAHLALKSGKVPSLEQALVVVRDGGDLPVKTEPLTGQVPDTLSTDLLVELLTEVQAIRAENAELAYEVQALRAEVAASRVLPLLADVVADEQEVRVAAAVATALPPHVPTELVDELTAARVSMAALLAEKRARDRHPVTLLLRLLGVRL